MLYYGRFDLY
jgi:hypothetical protein